MSQNSSDIPATNAVIFALHEKVVISCILTLLVLIGVIGNLLVCIIFVQNKSLRTTANCFIVNLAVADILQSATIIFMIVSLLSDGWKLGNAVCQMTGFMNISFIITSLLSLAMISMQRYLTVVNTGRGSFQKKHILFMVIFSWLFPAALAISPILGWSIYEYRPGKLMCTLQFSYNISYTITLVFCALLVPFIIICFSTYKILKTVRGSRNRVANSTTVSQHRRKHEVRVSTMLLSVIICFLVFYSPASIVNFIQLGYGNDYSLPYQVDAWTVVIAMFNHANNPIIYGLLNKNFSKAFRAICSKSKRSQLLTVSVVTTKNDK